MVNENKYQAICNILKERIAAGFYTDKLPPRRELMEEFQVSSRTLHKVFVQLKMLGIIDPSPQGTVICSAGVETKHCKPVIILITPSEQSEHVDDVFIQTIIDNINKHNFELDWSVCTSNKTLEMLKNKSLSRKDSVIFANSTFSVEAGNYLKEKNITFVSSNRPAMGVDINWVDWNHLELFDDIIGSMVNCGARYMTFFSSGSAARIQDYLPDNHWQILDDFEAAKKSYLLFYPKISERSEELYCDAEKYVDHLLTHKHLPQVIWSGCCEAKAQLIEALQKRKINTDKILFICLSHRTGAGSDYLGIYAPRSLQKLGKKVWESLMFSRLHPQAPCRGIKQHCEFVYNKSFKKIKFNQH